MYLGGNVRVHYDAWELICSKKESLFLADTLELIWTKRQLLNRCLNKEKKKTYLGNRSPMKMATPSKLNLWLSKNYICLS